MGLRNNVSKGFLIRYNAHSMPYYACNELVKWVGIRSSLLIKNETMFSAPVTNLTASSDTLTFKTGQSHLSNVITPPFLAKSKNKKFSILSKLI